MPTGKTESPFTAFTLLKNQKGFSLATHSLFQGLSHSEVDAPRPHAVLDARSGTTLPPTPHAPNSPVLDLRLGGSSQA